VTAATAALPASHDPLCRWAAQDLTGVRVFTNGPATAIASPGLHRRDRLVVHGPAEAAIPLVRDVLREVGPAYRPLGDRELIDALVAALPGLRPVAAFGWMDRTRPLPGTAGRAAWLPPAADDEIAALLDAAFPGSYAHPAHPGVRRWAGLRDPRTGHLAAIAADAWSAPTVGFIAGVATLPAARGQGLGRAVCSYAIAETLTAYGTAALIVDDDNAPALRLYRTLGLAYRPLGAAAVSAAVSGA
jgi:GNAT superfamily N-acetyltransferase